MGNFDAAAVIQAAATSNLGVVSLLVLVLAFLAWRFFQRSDDKVKLIAFAMMFLGAAGFVAAVMLAGGDANDEEAAAAPKQSPTPEPDSTGDPAPAQAGPAPEGVVNIAGAWHDADDYAYTFRQDGSTFSYTVSLADVQVGRGAGTLAGTRLSYSFANDDHSSEGTCEGEVAADARTIRGTCRDGADSWPFTIER